MDDAGEQRGFWAMLGHGRARVCLWLLVIVVGCLGALYTHLHPYFRQRAAVRAIEAAGGGVCLEEIEYDKDKYLLSFWRWLVASIFGDNLLSRATIAKIKTDESMPAVGGLNDLEVLTLEGHGISGIALDCLDSCSNLEVLFVAETSITAQGMERLKVPPKLKALSLRVKCVGDQWFERFAKNGSLRRLQSLDLIGCSITDQGLKQLKLLPDLEFLELSDTGVTDAGLARVKDLIALKSLELDNTKITDAGLPHLIELILLSTLNLDNTNITDAGLDVLAKMKLPLFIQVKNTKVTREGAERFRKARPDCSIRSDFPDEPATETISPR